MSSEIEAIINVIEDLGWYVPNKNHIVGMIVSEEGTTDPVSYFTAIKEENRNHICVLIDHNICIKYSWSRNEPALFDCPLGDPDCFEKLGVALEGLA
jgi:hypothetical protein